uniref:NAD-dependent protein deacylase n=1 Tax=Cacopsylla melanoneura TaxID=428564 RepID=A0A8D8ME66_9HEMI
MTTCKMSKLFLKQFFVLLTISPARTISFVPQHKPVIESDITKLKQFIQNHKKILVVTGAGISTESGIPDYRSEGVGLYARSDKRPVQFQDFLQSKSVRTRYWARNFFGWPRFSSFLPNQNHYTLKQLEDDGKLLYVITQNVDGLHYKAGNKKVVEMHGTAFRVICLSCDYEIDRHKFQKTLEELNPNISIESQEMRPDGDVEISEETMASFHVPQCPHCNGNLKPHIVFFGDNIPRHRMDKIDSLVEASDGVLVLGSSLTVYSGYRIMLEAADRHLPIAIVNIGPTRADKLATLKIDARCSQVLSPLQFGR